MEYNGCDFNQKLDMRLLRHSKLCDLVVAQVRSSVDKAQHLLHHVRYKSLWYDIIHLLLQNTLFSWGEAKPNLQPY